MHLHMKQKKIKEKGFPTDLRILRFVFHEDLDLGQNVRGRAGHDLEVGSDADLGVLAGVFEDGQQLPFLCI